MPGLRCEGLPGIAKPVYEGVHVGVQRQKEVVDLVPGIAVTIPLGTSFQFRATGSEPLEVIITTMPPWPGADEAVPADGHWSMGRTGDL